MGKAFECACIEFLILMILWFWSKSILWFWSYLRQVIYKVLQCPDFYFQVCISLIKRFVPHFYYILKSVEVVLMCTYLKSGHVNNIPVIFYQYRRYKYFECLQTLSNFSPLKNAMASATLWFISMHWLFYYFSNTVGKVERAFLERQYLA